MLEGYLLMSASERDRSHLVRRIIEKSLSRREGGWSACKSFGRSRRSRHLLREYYEAIARPEVWGTEPHHRRRCGEAGVERERYARCDRRPQGMGTYLFYQTERQRDPTCDQPAARVTYRASVSPRIQYFQSEWVTIGPLPPPHLWDGRGHDCSFLRKPAERRWCRRTVSPPERSAWSLCPLTATG